MRVLFAPDYRSGIPYQAHLADALREFGVEVEFLSNYSRGLPLFRGGLRAREHPDAIHLHWPEAYFRNDGNLMGRARVLRYPLDLKLLSSRFPIFLTAHNLLPHDRGEEFGVFKNIKLTMHLAKQIFTHSSSGRDQLCQTFKLNPAKCLVIPYGDHAADILPPLPKELTRERLQLPPTARQKVCLVFGTVSPYKGTDEVVRHWILHKIPHRLVVIGPIISETFAIELRALSAGTSNVDLRISERWLDDTELRRWLSAADCTIFNYREIFTSGAAAQARSFGLPILIPSRLKSADLGEPHPHVFRFESLEKDFDRLLAAALSTPPDYQLAAEWREKTSWKSVARITYDAYQSALTSC